MKKDLFYFSDIKMLISIFVIMVLLSFSTSIETKAAEIREPDEVQKSNTFKENALLANKDIDMIEKFVEKMDNEEYPKWCKVISGEKTHESFGSKYEAVSVDVYNLLANIELESDKKVLNSIPEKTTMKVKFHYDDLDVEFDIIDDDTFLYYDIDSYDFIAYKISGTQELFDYANELWDVKERQRKRISDIKNMVFRAEKVNNNEVNGSDEYLASTEYIITDDKTLYVIDLYNIEGFDIRESSIESSYDEFSGLLKKIESHIMTNLGSGCDGYEWYFYLYDDNYDLKKEYSGYIDGNKDFEKMAEYLEENAPLILY